MHRNAHGSMAIALFSLCWTLPSLGQLALPKVVTPSASALLGTLNADVRAVYARVGNRVEKKSKIDRLVADRIDSLKLQGVLTSARIVQPTGVAKKGEFPWMVAIEVFHAYEQTWYQICGGTLIAERMVLSAAHCTDFPKEYTRVLVDTVDLAAAADAQRIELDDIRPHPKFSRADLRRQDGGVTKGFVYDFALFVLKTKPKLSPLPTLQDVRRDATIGRGVAIALGWGITDGGKQSQQLLYVNLPIVKDDECGKAYSPLSVSLLCAGRKAGGPDACQGDSGGPLLARNSRGLLEQIGVISFGENCGEPDRYGVYGWLAAAKDWLSAELKKR